MITALFKWYLKWFRWLGIVFLITLVLACLTPLIDWIAPWDDAVAALKQARVSGLRIMVGESTSWEWTKGAPSQHARRRYFVVLPGGFLHPALYEFFEGTEIGKGLRVHPYPALRLPLLGLVSVLAVVGCATGAWLVRRRRAAGAESARSAFEGR